MLSKDAAWYYKKEKNAWCRLFMSPLHNLVHIVALGSSTSFIDSSDPILLCVCVYVCLTKLRGRKDGAAEADLG